MMPGNESGASYSSPDAPDSDSVGNRNRSNSTAVLRDGASSSLQSLGDSFFLIQVFIVEDNVHASSKVKITPQMTAAQVCSQLADKLSIPPYDANFYSLVVVFSSLYPPGEGPPHHSLRTLAPTDVVLNVLQAKEKSTPATKADMYSTKWYYKDIRSPPLNFEGDLSGESSSEDEVEVPSNDFNYMLCEKGEVMLKRSSKDLNLWRRRRCVIGDTHLWSMRVVGQRHRAAIIPLEGTSVYMQDDIQQLNYPYCVAVQTRRKTVFFRAEDEDQQLEWFSELNDKMRHATNNYMLSMAEVIICGEEETRNQSCTDSITDMLKGGVLSAVTHDRRLAETITPRAASIGTGYSDNRAARWSIHDFHSNHPQASLAMAFVVAVHSEYKDLFMKFVRPTSQAYWDCAIDIYKRFIMPELENSGKATSEMSLCFPTLRLVGESVTPGERRVRPRESSYLAPAGPEVLKLQQVLYSSLRWRSNEDVLAETAAICRMLRDRDERSSSRGSTDAAPSLTSWWYSGVSPTKDRQKTSEVLNMLQKVKENSSRCQSRRVRCCSRTVDAKFLSLSSIPVVEYVVQDDEQRPPHDLFDGVVAVVLERLQSPRGCAEMDGFADSEE